MTPHPDDGLEDLLGGSAPPADERLRRQILLQTTAVLHRRQRRRRIGFALAIAAGILLLLGSIAWFRPRMSEPAPPVPQPTPDLAQTPTTPELAGDAPAALIERVGETSASELRAKLYRRAGDRYLEVNADVDAALRCYTLALDDGDDDDLKVSADDSWLLMALKLDRQKEKRDANRN